MPIYEFKCDDCGKEFEELVFGSEPDVPCPACGSKKTARLMSCCRHKNSGGASTGGASSSGSSCSGCSGGNCASCH